MVASLLCTIIWMGCTGNSASDMTDGGIEASQDAMSDTQIDDASPKKDAQEDARSLEEDATIVGDASAKTCPSDMVLVQHPPASFCIDKLEASWSEMFDFLDRADLEALEDACPQASGGIFRDGRPEPEQVDPNWPANGMSFCSAQSYCAFRGKRLCGGIESGGDMLAVEDYDDPTKSEWYLACAGEEKRAFPYGDSYVPGICEAPGGTTNDWGYYDVRPVGDAPKCNGAHPGLFDMSMNIAEWVNECVTGTIRDSELPFRKCRLRGGDGNARNETRERSGCAFDSTIYFDTHVPADWGLEYAGVRCCKDAS